MLYILVFICALAGSYLGASFARRKPVQEVKFIPSFSQFMNRDSPSEDGSKHYKEWLYGEEGGSE